MSTIRQLGISILMPCYNSGEYLREAVDSILAQAISFPFEVLIIDDGSTDPVTIKVLKTLSQVGGNVRMIYLGDHKGTQFARNVGLSEAKYRYITALDSDDRLSVKPNVISKGSYYDNAIQLLEKSVDSAFVYCTSEMFGNFSGYTVSAYPVNAEQVLNKHHMQQFIVYRKEDARHFGYDVEVKKWTDWSFAVSIINSRYMNKKKNEIQFIDLPYHNYRIHTTQVRMSENQYSESDMVTITIKKNFEIYSQLYPGLTLPEIAQKVTSRKPSRLVDLLYIASYDLNRAINMVAQRGAEIISSKAPESVP